MSRWCNEGSLGTGGLGVIHHDSTSGTGWGASSGSVNLELVSERPDYEMTDEEREEKFTEQEKRIAELERFRKVSSNGH